MAELGFAGDLEATPRRRRYSWRAPRWLPAALVGGGMLWGAGIWWMSARVESPAVPHDHTAALVAEVAAFNEKVEGLTQQLGALGEERETLATRVAALETRLANASVTASAATSPLVVQMDLTASTQAYSIPRFAYPRSADPQATPSVVFAAAVPAASAPAYAGTAVRFFTNGADRYNCTSFGSQAEAQEALAANAPGDPNRLDMNGNGVACEDITYAANTPKNMTPIANRNNLPASQQPSPTTTEGVHHAQHP